MQLTVSDMCHFHSSFTVVIFLFCSPFSFMAFVAYRFFSWCLPPSSQHISSIIRLQYSFYNLYCPYFFNCLLRVSLLGFLSVYSTYPFQASFMVFSSPNLVFVTCVAFSLVFWHLLLLYKCHSVFITPFFGQLNSGPIFKDCN